MEHHNILAVLEKKSRNNRCVYFRLSRQRHGKPYSDLDIAVQSEKVLTTEQHISLVEDLALATSRPIDLIDLKAAGEPLLGEILQGIRLAGSDANHAELIKRHVFDSADFLPYVERMLAERRAQWTK